MGFRFTLLSKPGCPPTRTLIRKFLPPDRGSPDTGCQHFVDGALAWVLQERPSAVILSSHNLYSAVGDDANGTALGDGVVAIAKRFTEAGIPVLGIKGTPTMKGDAPSCLSQALARVDASNDITACSAPLLVGLRDKIRPLYSVDEAASMYPILRLLSLDDVLCPGGMCLPIVGNVVVYCDGHHLTVTFARTLANVLERKLRDAAPHLENLP